MKKLSAALCLLLTLVFITQSTKAQADFGIRGGLNFAMLYDASLNLESRTGLLFGAFAEIPLYEDMLIFQPEILYTQKGFEGPFGREFKLHYFEIPLLVKVPYLVNKTLSPFVCLGPFVGINVAAEQEAIRVIPSNSHASSIIRGQASTVTLGIIVGAGIDISDFEIGVRYSAGLTPAFEGESNAKNGVLSFVGGYTF